jgi:DNA-binding FrmR family transcriptional regulator
VAHTIREKTKLIHRVRRIRGQIEAIERALEAEQECADVLQLIAASRGAMNSLMAEVLEGHIRFHILDAKHQGSSEQAEGAQELIDVVRSYLK